MLLQHLTEAICVTWGSILSHWPMSTLCLKQSVTAIYARLKAQTIPLRLDLTGVGQQAGDFKTSDLGTALDPYLYQIADEMVKYCQGRKDSSISATY